MLWYYELALCIHQLLRWDLLAEATRVSLAAQLWMLFEDLDEDIGSSMFFCRSLRLLGWLR